MDTGVRDLEVACFKANFTRINDIGSKDLSNSPTYTVLNTHNLDMILQLKVHLNPKYFFGLNKSLHLFETHLAVLNLIWTFL